MIVSVVRPPAGLLSFEILQSDVTLVSALSRLLMRRDLRAASAQTLIMATSLYQ